MRRLLPTFAYDRPVTVLMAFAALLLLGMLAWVRVPVQMWPSGFEPSFLWVWVPYPNASPRETDEQVVRVVEEQLATVTGIKTLNSSANSGSAFFEIEFHGSQDMDDAYNAVVDRLERAMPNLPDDVEDYGVFKFNPDDQPVMWVGVSLPEDADSYYLLTRVVQPRLERITGVAALDVWGVDQRQVYVDYDRDAIMAHGVNLQDLATRLAKDNFQMAGGSIEERGLIRYVRSLATLQDVEDLKRYPVADGVVLEDVAEISMRSVREASINRINGREAAAFAVKKESSANAVAVCERIEDELRALEGDSRLQGAQFFTFFSQGELIDESMNNLLETAALGGVFAVIILFIFLREWRMTLLIAASIPFSLLLTVAVLYFRGESLNLLALMGLMLAVGMVVDNAIVVIETIYRRRAEGAGNRAATIEGTSEVNLAILLSTATTMVVFLPIILMSENAIFSFFMSVLGLPVVFALAASLLVALIFAPFATRFVTKADIKPDPRWLQWLADRYERVLAWVLAHRADALASLVGMIILTVLVPMRGVGCTDGAGGNLNDFTIRFTVPREADPNERDDIVRALEGAIETHRDDWGVRVYRSRLDSEDRGGSLYVYLIADGPMPREDVMEAAKEAMPDDLPGVTTSIGWEQSAATGDANTIDVAIHGEDMDVLDKLGDEVSRRVEGLPGILGARMAYDASGADEIRLRVDPESTARYGVTALGVAQTVAYAMRGQQIEPLREGEREVDVITRFSVEDRSSIEVLRDFPVFSPRTFGMVPLRALTAVEVGRGPASIHRQDRRTGMIVTVDLDDEVTPDEGYALVSAALADMVLPRGYSWSKGRSTEIEMAEDDAQQLALLLSITFVFLLMGVLFESFLLPLSIITTVPMAIMGAFWGLYLTDTPMDTMAGVGLVILVGVVVNNGIVLIDLVTQLRKEGVPREVALVEAGKRRLRPILMTAATTVFGLVPMAVGSASFIGIPYAPLGRIVMGGLTAATVLTLVFVPLLYALLDDVGVGFQEWRAFVTRNKEAS